MGFTADTIVAIATPPGRGGIGVVRLSGKRAREIGEAMLRLRHPLQAGRVRFGQLLDRHQDGTERVLDDALATFFAGPRSYTGEDVLELATHGAPVVLQTVVEGAIRAGARLAEPGEFTQRAFLSGRLDLTQAEAVHDLISATTLHQARLAASQMGGALSREIAPVKTDLVTLIATLEAGVDFAEDDLEVMPEEEIARRITALQVPLTRLERSFRYGNALREGLTLTIVGRPNAGKSSLFNALLERNRAIVTATPGTTRDAITERVAFAGVPVEITDTAGLREAADEIEAMGIARSREALAEAAIVLLVLDATASLQADDAALLRTLSERAAIVVLNKADLVRGDALEQLSAEVSAVDAAVSVVITSATSGRGLEELRGAIEALLLGGASTQDSAFLTNARQHRAICNAQESLQAASAAVEHHLPHEMVLLDLHAVLGALDELTGQTTPDDILSLIFSSFCIGK